MPKEKSAYPVELTCPECETKVTVKDKETVCACGLSIGAVYERYRHERALKKMHDADVPKKEPFSFF